MNSYKSPSVGTLQARTSGSKIFLKWSWINSTVPPFVENTNVFYIIEGQSKVHNLRQFDSSSVTEYVMTDVLVDAKYKICLRVIMTAKWLGVREPPHICTTISNNKWELSAFFGSTAGALLALILIILLILFSKRAKKRQKAMKTDVNDKIKRQRFDSAFESQFDSVAIREDTSFYDEYIISDISFYDSSIRSPSDVNISTNVNNPTVIVGDLASLKGIKKRASLIEEESTGGQSHNGVAMSVIFRDGETTYQNHSDIVNKGGKSPILPNDNKNNLIDEVKDCDIN